MRSGHEPGSMRGTSGAWVNGMRESSKSVMALRVIASL
jgi:hypothetical protein